MYVGVMRRGKVSKLIKIQVLYQNKYKTHENLFPSKNKTLTIRNIPAIQYYNYSSFDAFVCIDCFHMQFYCGFHCLSAVQTVFLQDNLLCFEFEF